MPYSEPHFRHWPPGLPRSLQLPETSLTHLVAASARRYPDKPCVLYYGTALSYGDFLLQVEQLAGFLQQDCGVEAGDRVLICLQNCPQWMVAYHAILRANAVVVPVNPMYRSEEFELLVQDCGAKVGVVGQELLALAQPFLSHLVVACYSDCIGPESQAFDLPDMVRAPASTLPQPGVTPWREALACQRNAGPHTQGPADLCVLAYTSGTTGQPKGCMHTHRSVTATALGGMQWFGLNQASVLLSVLPLFHVTGMTTGMNGALCVGATVVLMSRWESVRAAQLIERYRVCTWQAIATMVLDFVAQPAVAGFDLSSLKVVRGGGAPMPEAVAQRLKALTGLDYVEGYGLTETMAATHINPPQRPKARCLGIPVFDVDARLINPQNLELAAPGEAGELVVHGPQLMEGYWQQEAATTSAFVQIGGRRYLRTGDLARMDDDGYFFMVDRLKRMINASGYKVWPAEVEAMLYHHPALHEVCVIGARDPVRGETVKAVVVVRPTWEGRLAPQDVIDWCRERMAAYKIPRIVALVDELPKSGSGKILWRVLQAQQDLQDSLIQDPPQTKSS